MYIPPADSPWKPPTDRSSSHPDLTDVLTGYALVASVLPALWVVTHPLAGAVALAAVGGLLVVTRRAVGLARCFDSCQQLTVDLAGNVRITITQLHTDD